MENLQLLRKLEKYWGVKIKSEKELYRLFYTYPELSDEFIENNYMDLAMSPSFLESNRLSSKIVNLLVNLAERNNLSYLSSGLIDSQKLSEDNLKKITKRFAKKSATVRNSLIWLLGVGRTKDLIKEVGLHPDSILGSYVANLGRKEPEKVTINPEEYLDNLIKSKYEVNIDEGYFYAWTLTRNLINPNIVSDDGLLLSSGRLKLFPSCYCLYNVMLSKIKVKIPTDPINCKMAAADPSNLSIEGIKIIKVLENCLNLKRLCVRRNYL